MDIKPVRAEARHLLFYKEKLLDNPIPIRPDGEWAVLAQEGLRVYAQHIAYTSQVFERLAGMMEAISQGRVDEAAQMAKDVMEEFGGENTGRVRERD